MSRRLVRYASELKVESVEKIKVTLLEFEKVCYDGGWKIKK